MVSSLLEAPSLSRFNSSSALLVCRSVESLAYCLSIANFWLVLSWVAFKIPVIAVPKFLPTSPNTTPRLFARLVNLSIARAWSSKIFFSASSCNCVCLLISIPYNLEAFWASILVFCRFNVSRFFFAASSNTASVPVRCSGVNVVSLSRLDLSPVLSISLLPLATAIVSSIVFLCWL